MSKLAVVVPIFGELHETKSAWGCLAHSLKGDTDIVVIDNGASVDEGQEKFLRTYIAPAIKGKLFYHPFDDNLGVVKSIQWAYEHTDYDYLAFLHNDLYIYDEGWDVQVKYGFNFFEKAGLLGFFGAEGVDAASGRQYVYSNMLEAEIHGNRLRDGYREVAVLDGLCLITNREMLDARNGVDLNFTIHHFYDLDLSLESIDRGFKNYVIPVKIHHRSGLTACNPRFQEWATKYVGMDRGEYMLYLNNQTLWQKKWAGHLPWRVGQPWK